MGIIPPPLVPVRSTFGPRIGWRQALKEAIRDPRELCRRLGLPEQLAEQAVAGHGDFPVFVPLAYLARIRPGDPDDPLLRQVLPRAAEAVAQPGDRLDPVDDRSFELRPGLLQKYAGRVLLVTTGACAIHCRYCFRRHFPYHETPRSADEWQPAIEEIRADSSLREVILSGGDPWTLADDQLAALIAQLSSVPHLTRLRIHTRLPIMIPGRITDELLDALIGTRLTPVVVIHANHAAELDEAVAAALARLMAAGVMLLNQTVLLRGVNDSVDALAELSERLLALRVMPYYLHQLDRVSGAAHFAVPIDEGRRLMQALRARLPGYAVPRYVQEVPGKPHKVVLE